MLKCLRTIISRKVRSEDSKKIYSKQNWTISNEVYKLLAHVLYIEVNTVAYLKILLFTIDNVYTVYFTCTENKNFLSKRGTFIVCLSCFVRRLFQRWWCIIIRKVIVRWYSCRISFIYRKLFQVKMPPLFIEVIGIIINWWQLNQWYSTYFGVLISINNQLHRSSRYINKMKFSVLNSSIYRAVFNPVTSLHLNWYWYEFSINLLHSIEVNYVQFHNDYLLIHKFICSLSQIFR